MRISFLLLFISSFFIASYGQINMNAETANRLKSKELILIKTGDDSLDQFLLNAANLKWQFSDQIQLLDWKSSVQLVDDNPNTYVRMKLQLIKGVIVTSTSQNGFTTKVSEQNFGEMMKILYFEDSPTRVFETSLPSNLEISEGVLVESIQRSCNIIDNISIIGSWNKFFINSKNVNGSELKNLTLLIPNEILESPNEKDQIKKLYPFAIEFVDQSEIHEKVKANDPNFAYVIIGEEAVSLHVVYICTTSNSQTLCHEHKMIQTLNKLANGGRYATLDAKIFKKLVSGIDK